MNTLSPSSDNKNVINITDSTKPDNNKKNNYKDKRQKYNKNKYNKNNSNVNNSNKYNKNNSNVNNSNVNNSNVNNSNVNNSNSNTNSRLNYKELLFELNKLKKYQHSPKVDLLECNELYAINIELPGVIFEDIKIEIINNQVLLVSGTKHSNSYNVTKTIYSECRYNNFMRRIKLPSIIDKNTICKKMLNGVLTIQVNKFYSKEVTDKEVTDKEVTDKEVTDKEEYINWADDV